MITCQCGFILSISRFPILDLACRKIGITQPFSLGSDEFRCQRPSSSQAINDLKPTRCSSKVESFKVAIWQRGRWLTTVESGMLVLDFFIRVRERIGCHHTLPCICTRYIYLARPIVYTYWTYVETSCVLVVAGRCYGRKIGQGLHAMIDKRGQTRTAVTYLYL
jgi:hypothetical protein